MANQAPVLALQTRQLDSAVQRNRGLFLAEGILLVLLGLAAVVLPLLATLAVTVVLGWLFLISGGFGFYATWTMRHSAGVWWSAISALLAIAVGVLLLIAPVQGAVSLTYVLIVFFAVEGVASILYALSHRTSGRWVWLLVSGIVDIALAVLIVAGLPGSALWAPGLLVGINMVFGGVAMAAMALHARKPAA